MKDTRRYFTQTYGYQAFFENIFKAPLSPFLKYICKNFHLFTFKTSTFSPSSIFLSYCRKMASPSGYFSEAGKKSEVSELKKLLDEAAIQRDPAQYKKVIQRVIACMTLGMDMSSLFMQMIKAGATNDLVQKKLVYLYICTYAQSNPQLVILAVNTLLMDIKDSSSMIRGLALRSMTSLSRLPGLLEYIEQPVITALNDLSHYVRRTAVMGCVKLHHQNPDFVEEHDVINKLKKMTRDDDPQVVCNCIAALDEILAAEGGLVIDQALAHHLLKRLKAMSEWCQCQVLEVLTHYSPAETNEIFDIMNLIDARLKHPNGAVVMATIKLFLHLSKDNQELHNDVLQRVKGPLISMMSSTNYETIYTAICHMELLLAKCPNLFENEYKTFFLRFNDPLFLRQKKVQILTTIASESNVEEIVTEMSELVHDIDVELSQECIKAIGKIAFALPKAAEYCIDTLLSYLSREIESITSQTLIVIRDLLPHYEKYAVAVLPQLKECTDLVHDPKGKAAIIWMLGEYGQSIPESPYILESLVDNIEEEQSSEIKLQLLTAMMKLFFRKPPECQETLGRLLAYCIDSETHMDVHDRALMYYRLLREGADVAEKVVCGSVGRMSSRNSIDNKEANNSKVHLFSEFNTLSVVYGQTAVNFVCQTIPYIKGRPYTENNVSDIPVVAYREANQNCVLSHPSEVSVGNLLGDLTSTAETISKPKLLLKAHPVVSRNDFQQKWTTISQSSDITFTLDKAPSTPNEFEETLLSHHILMMAYSTGQTMQKYFHYAQQEDDGGLVLIETNINGTTKELAAKIKGDNNEMVKEFVEIYKNIITRKWIQ